MADLRAYNAAAGPAAMVLAICVVAGALFILGGPHGSSLAFDAVELLWWPAVIFWAVAAVAAWRGQGLWVATSAPLVIFPVALYGLLVFACWSGCDL
jgi:hypothetical protein